MYGASEGLRTIVIEREAPGGQAGTSSRIENYLGFPSGVSGDELSSRALQQARRLGAEILVTRSHHADRRGDRTRSTSTAATSCGRGRSSSPAGVSWRQLAIEGFDRLAGKGIFYGAARSEAANTHGLDVHIIGAGNSAGQAAMFFSTHARSVTILYRGETLEKSMSRYLVDQLATQANVHVALPDRGDRRARRRVARGDRRPRRATGETTRLESGGLFIFIGADAETPGCRRRSRSTRRATCSPARTSRRRTLGARPRPLPPRDERPGHLRLRRRALSPVKRVAAAVGEGSMAIAFVHQYLRDAEARPETA